MLRQEIEGLRESDAHRRHRGGPRPTLPATHPAMPQMGLSSNACRSRSTRVSFALAALVPAGRRWRWRPRATRCALRPRRATATTPASREELLSSTIQPGGLQMQRNCRHGRGLCDGYSFPRRPSPRRVLRRAIAAHRPAPEYEEPPAPSWLKGRQASAVASGPREHRARARSRYRREEFRMDPAQIRHVGCSFAEPASDEKRRKEMAEHSRAHRRVLPSLTRSTPRTSHRTRTRPHPARRARRRASRRHPARRGVRGARARLHGGFRRPSSESRGEQR